MSDERKQLTTEEVEANIEAMREFYNSRRRVVHIPTVGPHKIVEYTDVILIDTEDTRPGPQCQLHIRWLQHQPDARILTWDAGGEMTNYSGFAFNFRGRWMVNLTGLGSDGEIYIVDDDFDGPITDANLYANSARLRPTPPVDVSYHTNPRTLVALNMLAWWIRNMGLSTHPNR